MATTKVRGQVVDLRGGLPDYSLAATNTVTYLDAGGGNQYNFNGAYGLYGVVNGTYVLSSVSSSHPIAILNNGKTSLISYTGAVNEGSQTGPDGNTYTYYSGDVTITVSGNFDVVSYACKVHGYMGGQNNLIYTNLHSDLGLKIPTGTALNRPATDVAGMVRNTTSEASEGSASCQEYYNGTDWKRINNIALPILIDYLIVGGGGSGGSIWGSAQNSGGGGAGGLRTSFGSTSGGGASAESQIQLSAGTYTITIGAGGVPSPPSPSGLGRGNNGNLTSLAYSSTTVLSVSGGGRGEGQQQSSHYVAPGSGGSGGGAGCCVGTIGSGTANEGFDGGSRDGSLGGGGGGASAAGVSGSSGAQGGNGLAVSITGSSVTYAGGGGGGGQSIGSTGGTGGGGDAGNGSAGDATASTGGGGGGSKGGGNGGSGAGGVFVLRIPTFQYSGTTTGSPTITTDGTDTILKYTGSGTYVQN